MLQLCAESPYGTRHILGTAPLLRFAGMHLEDGSVGERLATYSGGCWTAKGMHFPRLDVPMPVTVTVERADGAVSRKLGEFKQLTVADGAVHADGQIVARCRPGCVEWMIHDDTQSWPVMVLSPRG